MKRLILIFTFACVALFVLGDQSVTGSRIAKMDTYDFFPADDENAVAIVDSTSYSLSGKYCKIVQKNDGYKLIGFFGDYEIPININEETGEIKIECGSELDKLKNYEDNEFMRRRLIPTDGLVTDSLPGIDTIDLWVNYPTSRPYTTWTLYAYPLTWLVGESDNYDFIHGTISGDSISFSEGFGFMVKEIVYKENGTKVSWGLSSIMENVTLLKPNGIHSCVKHYMCSAQQPSSWVVRPTGPHGESTGGIVHRPINPLPGSTKPVSPRPHNSNPTIGCVGQKQSNTSHKIKIDLPIKDENRRLSSSSNETSESYEVYIEQIDNTTLRVFNLFGQDYSWNQIYINDDGTVWFPDQVVCYNRIFAVREILYNYSENTSNGNTSLTRGNYGIYSQDQIFLGDIYLCNSSEDKRGYFGNNQILINGFTLDVSNPACTTPENLIVSPAVTNAFVDWEDPDDYAWNLRYRPIVDTSNNPICCDLNGSVDGVEANVEQWDIYDGDGDGFSWVVCQIEEGDMVFCSASYDPDNSLALFPENWLISPKTKLQGVLSFNAWSFSPYNSDERMMLYVILDDNNCIIQLANEDIVTTATKTEYTFDLSEYEGQIGHIAFCHYNCSNQYMLMLDDIFIGDPNAEVVETPAWTVSEDLTVPVYLIEGLDPETQYEVQVRAIYYAENAVFTSVWTDPIYFITSMLGDVNRDNEVSVIDATILIDALLSNNYDESESFSPDNADINGDGMITVADVTTLIDYLLSGTE